MLIQGDCLEKLKELEDSCIDLTVTSPPYDNLRDYNGYTFDFKGIAKELYRVTKEGGVVVWVVGDATIKGSETGTSFKQALYFKEIGFNLHDTMIYEKQNPIPLTHNRYEQCFEYMFVLSKGKPTVFNPLIEDCLYKGIQSSRKTQRASESAKRKTDKIIITKDTKIKRNKWTFTVGMKTDNGNHPATFPEKLAEDHILSWSNEGDTVLDPMCGSGTTLKMAKLNNRKFIGIEISEEYFEIAQDRIKAIDNKLF